MPVLGTLVIEFDGDKLACIHHPATAKTTGTRIPTMYFLSLYHLMRCSFQMVSREIVAGLML